MRRILRIAGVFALSLVAVPASGSAHAMTWHRQRIATGALVTPAGLNQIACPSASACIGVDSLGGIAWSEHIGGSRMSWHLSGPLSPTLVFDSISCPSLQLCVAVDQAGGEDEAAHIAVSTDPTGGAERWSITTDTTIDSLQNVTCPTANLCVIDALGGLLVSTHPTAGLSSWKPVLGKALDDNDEDLATWTSCASASLCVTVGENGGIYESTDPAGGTSAWRQVASFPRLLLSYVDCPSTSLCVGLDSQGAIVTSTDPDAADPTWVSEGAVPGLSEPTRGISCTATGLCVAADSDGDIAATSDPAGTAPAAWVSSPAVDPAGPTSVTCTSAGLCLAPDGNGAIAESPAPATAQPDWQVSATPAGLSTTTAQPLTAVSCPSMSFCAATAGDGQIATIDEPALAGSWQVVSADPDATLDAISCPSIHFCAAIGAADALATSSHPTAGPAAWAPVKLTFAWENDSGQGPDDFDSIACPSASECLAPDADSSDIAVSHEPAGGPRRWSDDEGGQYDYDQFLGISCPTVTVCYASGLQGDLWTEAIGANPEQVAASGGALTDISCPTVSFCVATGTRGADSGDQRYVYVGSPHHSRWKEALIDPDPVNRITGVDCVSTRFCSAVDSGGLVMVSTDPAGGATTWHASDIDPGGSLNGIDCPSAALCVAVGANGEVAIARR